MANRNDGGVSPATVDLIGGLAGGAVSSLCTHPLDLAKTRMQSMLLISALCSFLADLLTIFAAYLSKKVERVKSAPTTFSILGDLLRSERPIRSLYRGV